MITKDSRGQYVFVCGACRDCKYGMYCDHICKNCVEFSLWEPKETKIKYIPKKEIDSYIKHDIEFTKRMINAVYGTAATALKTITIEKVIFNDPATIVLWKDGTKTVVKVQEGDIFDPEKGLAMAIAKKVYGNKGKYCDVIKKWTEKYEAESPYPVIDASRFLNVDEMHKQLTEFTNKLIKIRKENK